MKFFIYLKISLGKITYFCFKEFENTKYLCVYSHTTINYWHLNYFNTNKDNKNFLKNNFPEKILCHSENCRKYLLSQGYKSNQLIKVSAERFRWATKIKKKIKRKKQEY